MPAPWQAVQAAWYAAAPSAGSAAAGAAEPAA